MKHTDQKNRLTAVDIPKEVPLSTLLLDTAKIRECKCSYHKRFSVFEEDKELLDTIAKENYIYALMSANAYDKDMQISLPERKRTQRFISAHGFSADIYLSLDRSDIVIAFRGTDDKHDWIYGNADFDAHGQYEDADILFNQVRKAYPCATICTTGHSLGGGLAMHISLLNEAVDAIVFNPSPRIFVNGEYDKYENHITIIYEAGEILTIARKLFRTMKKITYDLYLYNYLGGHVIKEHGIAAFATCMYASAHKQESNYATLCKDNTLAFSD